MTERTRAKVADPPKTRKVKAVPNSQEIAGKTYLDTQEAAVYLCTTINYLYKLTSQHKLPMFNPTGRKILFRRADLDNWIESSRVLTNEELSTKVATDLMRKGGRP